MGSTEFINQTSVPLAMKIGNHRYFTNLATVDKNAKYTVKVDCNDTYREYRLEAVSGPSKYIIVNTDECVDNKRITIKEEGGILRMERLPRASSSDASEYEIAPKKKSMWKFW